MGSVAMKVTRLLFAPLVAQVVLTGKKVCGDHSCAPLWGSSYVRALY